MKASLQKFNLVTAMILLTAFASQSHASTCKSFLSHQIVKFNPEMLEELKSQAFAENYVNTLQENPVWKFRGGRIFIARATQELFMLKNLKVFRERVAKLTTENAYDQVVARVKSLLEENLISDKQIEAVQESIKTTDKNLITSQINIENFKKKSTALSIEVERLTTDLNKEPIIKLSFADTDLRRESLSNSIKLKTEEIASLDQSIKGAQVKIERYSEVIAQRTEDLLTKKGSRASLSKEVQNSLKEVRAFPKKVTALNISIGIREQKIIILTDLIKRGFKHASIPVFDPLTGEIKEVIKKYSTDRAEAELKILTKKDTESEIKKEINRLHIKQAHLYAILQIYQAYFIKASITKPETFGTRKERLLQSMTEALNNPVNSPGMRAFLLYENKVLRDETVEFIGFLGPSKIPKKDAILERMRKELGSAVSDVTKKLGTERNGIIKQALVPIVLGLFGAESHYDVVPNNLTEVKALTTSIAGEKVSHFGAQGSFIIDSWRDYSSTARRLSKVPTAERNEWLVTFIEEYDLNNHDGYEIVQKIKDGAKAIDAIRDKKLLTKQETEDAIRAKLKEIDSGEQP